MRLGSIVMSVAAFGLAIAAGLLAQSWLQHQRSTGTLVVEKQIAPAKIVVATQALRFGAELAAANLKEIDWPSTSVPDGAFASISDLLKANERRVVLSSIEINEPILKWKVTGPGQRASLSAVVDPGKNAVTIRVNDVFGVAGFVLPGDRVDVLLTHTENGANATKEDTYTDVLLQHVRVLAIDQLADDRTETPVVAKAVTLEVPMEDAQKLSLANTIGSLSLALTPAGSLQTTRARRITAQTLDDLAGVRPPVQVAQANSATTPTPEPVPTEEPQQDPLAHIVITRAVSSASYTVPFAVN